MKKIKFLSFIAAVLMLLSSCGTTSTVPISGRKHKLLVTDSEVLSLSNQEYTKYMSSAKKSTNATNTAMVTRVGKKLAAAVETYLTQNGYAEDVKNYSWEFNLVADNQLNAFCMPGGKIVVYEGLLPVTKDEASLAIVLGHEIAHAVAKHSAEQLSKQYRQQTGMQIGAAVLQGAGVSANTTSIAAQVASGLFSFRNMKYSRDNETEADYMGLILAAMAGYDPSVAPTFWQRMAASSSNNTAEWMSDHPSDATRIANINKWLPEAQKIYQATLPKKTTTTKKTTTKKTTKKSTTKKK